MLLLFVALVLSGMDWCSSQLMYNPAVALDTPYIIRRAPPARRSPMETLERLRLPMSRYFPQVDTQMESAPYEPPVAPLNSYQLTAEDIYALPPQWTEQLVQQLPQDKGEVEDYPAYDDYDDGFSPVYRAPVPNELYQQDPGFEPETSDRNLYNDLMVNYVLGDMEPKALEQPDIFGVQRRADGDNPTAPAEATANNTAAASNATAPDASTTANPTPQVQVTAVPASPERKGIQSLVIPEAGVGDEASDLRRRWMQGREEGQKEVPLFRPRQNSQKTTWAEQLSRAKNSDFKSPIPLIKQMIQSGSKKQESDPLTEELSSLQKHHSR